MKKVIVASLAVAALSGCQSTMSTLHAQSSVESALLGNNVGTISFGNWCATDGHYEHQTRDHRYFNDKYNKGGDMESCYQVLAEMTLPLVAYETVEELKAVYIKDDLGSIETYRRMATNPKYAADRATWERKVEWLSDPEIQRLVKWAETVDTSAPWQSGEYGDEFEGYKAITANPAYYSAGKLKMRTNVNFECRIKGNQKDFMFVWRVEDAIATPSSPVVVKAILGGKPVTMRSKLYSNSYRSGFIVGKDATALANHVLAGNLLKYRVDGDTSYADFEIKESGKTQALKDVLEACK